MKEEMLTQYDGRIRHGTTSGTFGDRLLHRVSRCIRPGSLTPASSRFYDWPRVEQVNGRRMFCANVVVKMSDAVWLRERSWRRSLSGPETGFVRPSAAAAAVNSASWQINHHVCISHSAYKSSAPPVVLFRPPMTISSAALLFTSAPDRPLRQRLIRHRMRQNEGSGYFPLNVPLPRNLPPAT